jgi:hypothetical protein
MTINFPAIVSTFCILLVVEAMKELKDLTPGQADSMHKVHKLIARFRNGLRVVQRISILFRFVPKMHDPSSPNGFITLSKHRHGISIMSLNGENPRQINGYRSHIAQIFRAIVPLLLVSAVTVELELKSVNRIATEAKETQ